MDAVKRLINQLANLLNDQDFKSEIKTFRSAYQRLRIRLRNNPLISHLKQLATSTRQLQDKFSTNLFEVYATHLNNDGKKLKKSLRSIQTLIQELINFLDTVLEQTLFVYCCTQPHFRVGHLIHHFIVLRTCISRYRICLKALLVYSCDLSHEISGLDLIDCALPKDRLDEILRKHECKPRNLSALIKTKPPIETIDIQDEVGQLVDRDTMKVERNLRSKRLKLN